MRTLKKQYRTAHAEAISWKQSLYKFLRNYRATPHTSTGVAPADLMFGRPMRTRLPELKPEPSNDKAVRKQDKTAKDRMKADADKRENIRKNSIKIGDSVIVKRDGHINKDQTPYLTDIYTVTQKKGSMITASNGQRTITRNSSFFKVIRAPPATDDTDIPPPADNDQIPEPAARVPNPDTAADEPRRNPPRTRRPPRRFDDFI
jgi:hypothetical protein